jgi:hypothetical protein
MQLMSQKRANLKKEKEENNKDNNRKQMYEKVVTKVKG